MSQEELHFFGTVDRMDKIPDGYHVTYRPGNKSFPEAELHDSVHLVEIRMYGDRTTEFFLAVTAVTQEAGLKAWNRVVSNYDLILATWGTQWLWAEEESNV